MKTAAMQLGGALLFVMGAAMPSLVMADDSSPGVTPGVLSSLPPASVAMLQARVQVKGKRATLSFVPQVAGDAKPQVVLAGEMFGWLGESEPYPDRHFPELQFTINNLPVQPLDSFVASVGKTDISALLRDAGVSPWAIADTPPFVEVEAIAPDALARLQKLGALAQAGHDYLAKWRAQRKWTIAADQPFAIAWDLRPAFALRSKSALMSAGLQKRYCFNREQLLSRLPAGPAASQFVVKEYVIPVSVDQRPPRALLLDFEPAPGVLFVASCVSRGSGVGAAQGLSAVAARPDSHGAVNILTVQASVP